MKKHKHSNEECPCKENEENVRNFRKRSRMMKPADSGPSKSVKTSVDPRLIQFASQVRPILQDSESGIYNSINLLPIGKLNN